MQQIRLIDLILLILLMGLIRQRMSLWVVLSLM
nr:MAG TPA: hypothetical protein [Bacteriophage sp.]